MVAIPFTRLPRAQAGFLVLEQRGYSPSQRMFAIGSPHLMWVNPPSRVLPPKLRAAVWAASDGCCAYCRVELTEQSFTVDHIMPRARGGAEDFDNLAVACRSCNSRKGARWEASDA